MTAPLWTPSPARAAATQVMRFRDAFNAAEGLSLATYADLHAASVERRAAFWSLVWDYCGVKGEKGAVALADDRMPGAHFFPQARLNFAENLLARSGTESDAIVFRGEDRARSRLSWGELHGLVSRLQQWLVARGVGPGDRVAAMMPNMPETVALMLAATSLGAVWSSCSPDFGVRGVLDRFGQIGPKVFVACDGYYYAGKTLPIGDKLAEIVPALTDLAAVLVVPYIGTADATAAAADGLDPAARNGLSAKPVAFTRLPFEHPLYILYSSGTTGCRSASCTGQGARCSSTSRSTACKATYNPVTGPSTSRLAAG